MVVVVVVVVAVEILAPLGAVAAALLVASPSLGSFPLTRVAGIARYAADVEAAIVTTTAGACCQVRIVCHSKPPP